MAIAFLQTRPECEWPYHWAAFSELSTERPIGFGGFGPIPYRAIRDMAREDRLSEHETDLLLHVVRVLDNRQREIAAERAEKQAKNAGK